ncbi:hypothetical protein [Paenibacillus sp. MMS18-CY102]|uniref:hypothetical protein n=1 Tax=Paenibacillus sp. MMS18-CY102 TaxID=2682849 RepID=UPI001F3D9AB0|nr:hypothetical protein [Paenibacillus sp. MMS18-CY102]
MFRNWKETRRAACWAGQSQWILFVPLAYLFIVQLDMGSIGAWLALYAYLTVFGLAVMIRFYRTDWSAVRVREAHGAL